MGVDGPIDAQRRVPTKTARPMLGETLSGFPRRFNIAVGLLSRLSSFQQNRRLQNHITKPQLLEILCAVDDVVGTFVVFICSFTVVALFGIHNHFF